jgi:NADPH:quinone reductase-like Zn-dependent oxidoreductase
MPRPNLIKRLWASKGVLGLSMPALWDDRGSYGPFLDPLVPLIEDGTIAPVIDAKFPFEKAADAHRRLMERRNIGKVVLVPTAG